MINEENKKILIIQNDLDFTNNLTSCLQYNKFDTLHTTNVNDALEIIAEYHPDGISLGIQLSGSLGLDFLHDIYSKNSPINYIPFIIVTSGWISSHVVEILKHYKIPYYDKSSSDFKFWSVSKSFCKYFDSVSSIPLKSIPNKNITQPKPPLPTGNTLRKIIRQKLEVYPFNTKFTGYKRLVEGIYYTLIPAKNQQDSLFSIYNEVLNVSYTAAFNSISRLLKETLKNENKLTPSDFIFQIASEIKNEYS